MHDSNNNIHYASLGRRFWALAIDFVFFCLLFFPITRIVKGVWIMTAEEHLWGFGWVVTDPLCIGFLIFIFLYFVFLEGFWGGTIGKKVLKLRVVSVDGKTPGLKRAFIRNILRIADSLPALNILGVVLILLSPERKRFGDHVAGTRIVRGE